MNITDGLLDYNPVTGDFVWLVDRDKNHVKGCIAGCVPLRFSGAQYVHIRIENKQYLAHRLAFLYMTGEFPKGRVRHVNGNTLDNSWKNLQVKEHRS